MPTYTYSCDKCNKKFTQFTSISKRNESVCPNCGNTENTREVGHSAGFVLKGEGFYESIKKNEEMYSPMEDK